MKEKTQKIAVKKDFAKETLIAFVCCVGFFLLRQGENLLGGLGFGLFVGCLYCHKRVLPSVFFVASGFLDGIWGGLIALSQAVVLLCATFFHSYGKKKIGKWWLFFYMILAHCLYFFYYHGKINTAKIVICFLVGIAFAYV